MDFSDINRTRVETLFTDLELAATFVTIAESSIGKKRERNLVNARLAYLTVKNKLLRLCTPTGQERARIRQVLHDLERRLRELSNEV